MKVLSIRQPYAWLIVNGIKTIENRSFITYHRGPLLIHAAKKIEPVKFRGIRLPEEFETGGIIGVVDVIDCVENGRGLRKNRWYNGARFAWVLANARKLPFAALPGKVGLFNAPDPSLPPGVSSPKPCAPPR